MQIFSEPLICAPNTATSPTWPSHTLPCIIAASLTRPPCDCVAPRSGRITALLRSSKGPSTHQGRRPGGSQVLPHSGCAPFLLTSPPAPFHGHSLVQGSAPAAYLGCPPQGSAGQTPSPPPCVNSAPSSHIDGLARCSGRQPVRSPPRREPADPAHLWVQHTHRFLIFLHAASCAPLPSTYPEYHLLESRDLCPERCICNYSTN